MVFVVFWGSENRSVFESIRCAIILSELQNCNAIASNYGNVERNEDIFAKVSGLLTFLYVIIGRILLCLYGKCSLLLKVTLERKGMNR